MNLKVAPKENSRALRVAQYSVLHLLRAIKHAGDQPTQTLFADVDIGKEQFIVLENTDKKRIASITSALNHLTTNTLVPKRWLDRALTNTQLTQYRDCCQQPTSLDDIIGKPDFSIQFDDYQQLIKQGDRYEAFATSARKRQSAKRDAHGKTSAQRYSNLAESSYEKAIAVLTSLLEPLPGMPFDQRQAELIRLTLDRPFDGRPGYEPSADAIGVPRLRRSRSRYTHKEDTTANSKNAHLLNCQRDALIPAALELLYGEKQIAVSQQRSEEMNAILKQKLKTLVKSKR